MRAIKCTYFSIKHALLLKCDHFSLLYELVSNFDPKNMRC